MATILTTLTESSRIFLGNYQPEKQDLNPVWDDTAGTVIFYENGYQASGPIPFAQLQLGLTGSAATSLQAAKDFVGINFSKASASTGPVDANNITGRIAKTNAPVDAVYTSDLNSGLSTKQNSLLVDSRIVYVGNSITQNGYVSYGLGAGNAENNSDKGFVNFANLLSGSNFFVPFRGNKGVSGDTTVNIIARMSEIIALKPKIAIVEVGTNDIANGFTQTQIQNNLTIIYNALKSIECKIIAITVLQRFGGSAFNGAQNTLRQNLNAWIKANSDVIAVDGEALNSASFFSDGLHPNNLGSYTLGSLVAAKILTLITSKNIADTLFPDNPYTSAPLLSGTSGSTNTATGSVASGWNLNGSEAGGASVVGSKSSDDKQVVTISGNYTGNNKKVQILHSKTAPASVVGDLVEGILDIEILSAMNNISTIDCVISAYNSDYSQFYLNAQALYSSDLTATTPLPIGRYTLRTAVSQLGAGAVNFNVLVIIQFKNAAASSPVSGSFKVHRAGIRKVNSL